MHRRFIVFALLCVALFAGCAQSAPTPVVQEVERPVTIVVPQTVVVVVTATPEPTTPPEPTATSAPRPVVTIPEDWAQYEAPDGSFMLSYPPHWELAYEDTGVVEFSLPEFAWVSVQVLARPMPDMIGDKEGLTALVGRVVESQERWDTLRLVDTGFWTEPVAANYAEVVVTSNKYESDSHRTYVRSVVDDQSYSWSHIGKVGRQAVSNELANFPARAGVYPVGAVAAGLRPGCCERRCEIRSSVATASRTPSATLIRRHAVATPHPRMCR